MFEESTLCVSNPSDVNHVTNPGFFFAQQLTSGKSLAIKQALGKFSLCLRQQLYPIKLKTDSRFTVGCMVYLFAPHVRESGVMQTFLLCRVPTKTRYINENLRYKT